MPSAEFRDIWDFHLPPELEVAITCGPLAGQAGPLPKITMSCPEGGLLLVEKVFINMMHALRC